MPASTVLWEQEREAEVRTGFSASDVQALQGKKIIKKNLLAVSIGRVGEGKICTETKGRDGARSHMSILAPVL